MTGITGEEKDLTETDKQALNATIETAKTNLTAEDQFEFIPRIIDFGYSMSVNEASPKNRSEDMSYLELLIPRFLFGKNGDRTIGIADYEENSQLQTYRKKKAKEKIKEEFLEEKLLEAKNNSGQEQDQLGLEIIFLKDELKKLNEEIQNNFRESERQMDTLRKQIADKSEIYEQKYNKNVQNYENKFEQDFEMKFETDLPERMDIVRNQYTMKKFHEANNTMKRDIGKSYPETVLKELAQIMADCLSADYIQRPTAEESYETVSNLLLFTDWSNDQ
ncbi:MAG: hypothetical protein LBH08_02500 [Puniceicoccales bacterium]|jgi:hypothetical protein|nr:hypothetical protein [Puniceicoccales bacterium]